MSTIRLNLFGITMLAFVLLALAVAPTVGEASVKVTVTPEEVYAGDIVDVKVVYEITANFVERGNSNPPVGSPAYDPDANFDYPNDGNPSLVITLPDDWEAAYSNVDGDGTVDSGSPLGDPIGEFGGSAHIGKRHHPNTTSYVVVTKLFRNQGAYIVDNVAGIAVTVDLGTSGPNGLALKKGNKITVEFHNVRVPSPAPTDLLPVNVGVTDARLVFADDPGIEGVNLELMAVDYDAMTEITASDFKTLSETEAMLGKVSVTPAEVIGGDTVNLVIEYTSTDVIAREADDGMSSHGRIRVALPTGWGPVPVNGIPDDFDDRIATGRSTDMTYVQARGPSSVKFAKNPDGKERVSGALVGLSTEYIDTDTDDYWVINIDVDEMTRNKTVTLTVYNLAVEELELWRTDRSAELDADRSMKHVEVKVHTDNYVLSPLELNAADLLAFVIPDIPPVVDAKYPTPKVISEEEGSDDQFPTISIVRKKLGELTVSPDETTAGALEDFEIDYKVTKKAMESDDVIEVRLPRGWAAPTLPALTDPVNTKPKSADVTDMTPAYAYLSGSGAADAKLDVIDDNETSFSLLTTETGKASAREEGWIVKITLKSSVKVGRTITLHYNNVRVQRDLATDDTPDAPARIEAYSVADLAAGNTIPQYPADGPKDVTVDYAANGSGVVTFELAVGGNVTDTGKPISNSSASIPAGIEKDDERELQIKFKPVGNMGPGKFEIRIPPSWGELTADDVSSQWDDTPTLSGSGNRTVTVDLPDEFGVDKNEDEVITLENIVVPNVHGPVEFRARSMNVDGTRLAVLSPVPEAAVGNIVAARDSVAVKITPSAAYINDDNVDFEFTLTAAGPMHDSEIQINMPEGITVLQMDTLGDPNYIRKVSPSVKGMTVEPTEDDVEIILVKTGELNEGGTIRVRLENVDLTGFDPVDFEDGSGVETQFVVDLRTRAEIDPEDDDKENTANYEEILNEDGTRSIVGGMIRTVAGSGMVAINPATVNQGSRSVDIKIVFTATTDFTEQVLEIVRPSEIVTDLQEEKGSDDGHVDSSTKSKLDSDVDAEDRLVITGGNTITWDNVTLKKGEEFITVITEVDIQEDTGEAQWAVSLGGKPLPATDNPPVDIVGTTREAVVFEVVDDDGFSVTNPEYNASSLESIRFSFTTANTVILPDGHLRLTLPAEWNRPSVTERTGYATVSIVTTDADDKEEFVSMIPGKDDDNPGEELILRTSNRDIIIIVGEEGELNQDSDPIIIRYGDSTDAKKYPVKISSSAVGTPRKEDDGLSIRGYYKATDERGFRERSAGTIWADVINVVDGSGTATLETSGAVRAGSSKNKVTVTFTGQGTMDGGAVRLTIPAGWGPMQDDPLERNYIEVDTSSGASLDDPDVEIVDGGLAIEVNLETFGMGDTLTFTYGGGSGDRDTARGAEAQAEIDEATFTLETDGATGGGFEEITDEDSLTQLTFEVEGAASGSGEGEFVIMENKSGEALYDGDTDVDDKMRQVHAGDDGTYIVFTYTPSETIADGQLRFTVPSTWTPPQEDATGDPGYTQLKPIGDAVVTNEVFSEATGSVTADIILSLDDKVEIHYGAHDTENGGAVAPAKVLSGRSSQFTIAIKGTAGETGFQSIDGENLAVRVRVQRSGGGMATVSPMTVNAGDMMRKITITYTAEGQIDAGQLRLTIPPSWPPPTSENVMVDGGAVSDADVRRAGDYMEAELTALAEAAAVDGDLELGDMDVIVDNVALAGGEMVVFTYTAAMVQGTVDDADFAVAFNGGDGPGTDIMVVDKSMTTVMVEEAAPGSGTAVAMTGGIVKPGTTGNTLTFTYTVAGEAFYPSDVRVVVPDGWTPPASRNDYTVMHERDGDPVLDAVEPKDPADGAMIARVVDGESVIGGDQIIFTFEDVTAPADADSYEFEVIFREQAIAVSPMVIVQSEVASKLVIDAPDTVVGDVSGASVAITIKIQDADDGEAASADDVTVNLVSTNTSTGSFSLTAGGDTVEQAPIPAGMSSAMVYYSDSRVGSTPTILISDDDSVLSSANTTIQVIASVDKVDSVMATPAVATVGNVTVTVKGVPGKTGRDAAFSVGELVTGVDLTESATSPGTYTGTLTVVNDLQDGTHDVMATLGEANLTETGALTIDTMMPSITLTAPAAGAIVANGGSVTITATAGDGTGSGIASVTADVSTLDSTQTDVALAMGADGSYSVDVAISDDNDNEALNGLKTITVTATDAAGNSAMAEATVTLDNKMSFTSTIPTGLSLFHVPLDVDGLDTVGDLKTLLGDAVTNAIVYDSAAGSWNSRSDAVAITSSLGIILSMSAEATVTFDGDTWDGGTSTISLSAGANLIGLPVSDPRVINVSNIAGLFTANVVLTVIVSTDDGFKSVGAAGDAGDGPVMGDAAYLVTASAAGNAVLIGDGWTNSAGTSAAPIALAGYNVDNQTPVLDVHGSVVDEITGLAREGFRVKVKNLSTKAALSSVSSIETADGYNMTFVDLKAANAARIGDVLEISADSPNPFIGVKLVRHIVTVDDVKNSAIQLENLIAYEIPAETELLRNYPNPFNPETWIPYHLSEDADVKLTIYDISGEVVRDIDVGHQTAAKYDTRAKAIYWDGRNRFGEQVASGIYFYHLDAGDFSGTRKMVILK